MGVGDLRQLFKEDPNLSSVLQEALEKALEQLRRQRQKEIGVLPEEEKCFENWLSALRKGEALSEAEEKQTVESLLTAGEQEEREKLWNLVENWLKKNAKIQVPESLLRFLRERLPETFESYLSIEISQNQQVLNQLVLSLMTRTIQILYSLQFGKSHVATFLSGLIHEFIRDYSSKVFVGRKGAFEELNRFLLGERGVAIVYAPAGYGKTTFLANWVF